MQYELNIKAMNKPKTWETQQRRKGHKERWPGEDKKSKNNRNIMKRCKKERSEEKSGKK